MDALERLEDLSQMLKFFKFADKDGSGKIGPQEMVKLLQSIPMFCRFEWTDVDKDGQINVDEFVEALDKAKPNIKYSVLQFARTLLDESGNLKTPPQVEEESLDLFDACERGGFSIEEVKLLRRLFGYIDKNRSGKLDAVELKDRLVPLIGPFDASWASKRGDKEVNFEEFVEVMSRARDRVKHSALQYSALHLGGHWKRAPKSAAADRPFPALLFSPKALTKVKVTVVGAAGGIGQPLSLLLKLNPKITHLSLYDVVPLAAGVAADVSHINTPAKVTSQSGKEPEKMRAALQDADVVIIPAGVPRKPGMTRQDLFSINAGIVAGIAEGVAEACPNALVGIISNPVNSTVPIFCDTLKKLGKLNPKRVFGISTLDILRANTFVAELKGLDVKLVNVPVIGGHSGNTIVPLLSRAIPGPISFTQEELDKLTVRIQNAGTEVVEAKAGAGSATLSMAQAGARFANSLIRGLSGESGVVECTYVISDACPGCAYFATEVEIGKDGVQKINPIGKVSDYEQKLIEKAVGELKGNIQEGVDFVAQKK